MYTNGYIHIKIDIYVDTYGNIYIYIYTHTHTHTHTHTVQKINQVWWYAPVVPATQEPRWEERLSSGGRGYSEL